MQSRHLAAKLLQIREALELSQTELLYRLGVQDQLIRANISSYEKGRTEPPLPVLLGYARLANVSTDVLIDDELKLPKKLPAKPPRKS
ncbi:MAG TPA: helix-turn-helix transcriptional regulator [Blastocatellia bacterium]|nr:helix-turn-helix transcriptional regulator [Blastocatellia bacterium]